MSKPVRILETKTLSEDKYLLRKVTYRRGDEKPQAEEVYDAGNAAAILLYDPERKMVLLTRQFRLPTFLNGNPDGLITEVCAGKLDNESPKHCILREVEEELGYTLPDAAEVMTLYMSPGAYTEKVYLFAAQYAPEMKQSAGGGLAEEGEEVETVEMGFDDALAALERGAFGDAKTVVLLQHAVIKGWISR